jgi:hypothetical protein
LISGFAREIRDERIDFIVNLARDYGDLVRFPVFGRDVYLVSHPDHVKEIFVTGS